MIVPCMLIGHHRSSAQSRLRAGDRGATAGRGQWYYLAVLTSSSSSTNRRPIQRGRFANAAVAYSARAASPRTQPFALHHVKCLLCSKPTVPTRARTRTTSPIRNPQIYRRRGLCQTFPLQLPREAANRFLDLKVFEGVPANDEDSPARRSLAPARQRAPTSMRLRPPSYLCAT